MYNAHTNVLCRVLILVTRFPGCVGDEEHCYGWRQPCVAWVGWDQLLYLCRVLPGALELCTDVSQGQAKQQHLTTLGGLSQHRAVYTGLTPGHRDQGITCH